MLSSQLDMSHIETETAICKISIMMHGHPYIQSTGDNVYSDTIHSNDIVLQTEVPDKYSPLMLASKFGHAECVTLLMKKGASVEVKSERNYNCLMEAIKAGHK